MEQKQQESAQQEQEATEQAVLLGPRKQSCTGYNQDVDWHLLGLYIVLCKLKRVFLVMIIILIKTVNNLNDKYILYFHLNLVHWLCF